MNLSKLEKVKDREAWCAAAHGVKELDMTEHHHHHLPSISGFSPLGITPPLSSESNTLTCPVNTSFGTSNSFHNLKFSKGDSYSLEAKL